MVVFVDPIAPSEIAKKTGLSEANVLKIIQRANKKLSKRVDLKRALLQAIAERGGASEYRFKMETTFKIEVE